MILIRVNTISYVSTIADIVNAKALDIRGVILTHCLEVIVEVVVVNTAV